MMKVAKIPLALIGAQGYLVANAAQIATKYPCAPIAKIALLLLILLSGCAVSPHFPSLPEQQMSQVEQQAWIATLPKTAPAEFKALLKGSVIARGRTERVRYAIKYRAPDTLKIEILPTLGFYSLGRFEANSRFAKLLDQKGRLVISGSTEKLLLEQFRLPLTVAELVTLLSGQITQSFMRDFNEFFQTGGPVAATNTKHDRYVVVNAGQLVNFSRWDKRGRQILNVERSGKQIKIQLEDNVLVELTLN